METNIIKFDEELGVVYGWASVIEKDGQPFVDHHGDVIEEHELLKAAHLFVKDARVGGFMHLKDENDEVIKVGEVVASFPLTRSVQKAFGIDLPLSGWAIGIEIHHPQLLEKVKEGEFPAFSIGAKAIREEITT